MKPKTFSLVVTVFALLALALTSGSKAIAQEPGPQVANGQMANGPDGAQALQASVGTGFTYQGQLKQGGNPVNGACDFVFKLYSAAALGVQIGTDQPVTGVQASNGYFTINKLDFGGGAFKGEGRWLAISVRCPAGSGSYTDLSPRQELTPAPYALALPGLWTQQNYTSPSLIGGYSGNSVTANVVGATIGGGGASGSLNRVTDDYGTVGGGSNNRAGDDAGYTFTRPNATVGGGYSNTASGDYATVGGGQNNTASGSWSTIGGGRDNIVSGSWSTIGGGYSNDVTGSWSFAAGNRAAVSHNGTFVWSDSTSADFVSTGNNQFLIRANGGVGIGTNSPATSLQVARDFSSSGGYGQIEAIGATNPNKRLTLGFDTTNNLGWIQASETGVAYRNLALNPAGGNVGVGATNPNQKLVVNSSATTRIAVDAPDNAGVSLRQNGTSRWSVATTGTNGDFQIFEDDTGYNRIFITGAGANQGNVGIGTTNPTTKLDVAGTMASNVVQIRGGSDLAERFDVEGDIVIEPGTLMVIDDEHPGKLEPSSQAYDTKVAGIASGAGGVQPGLTLHQAGVMEGNTLVAIAGRVYVKADASHGSIRPGDLLTTSDTPGHVMKVTDCIRAQGAIIGKAMSALNEGQGLVLVLVSLQ